ncbi:enoyl-CoA hydratase/isomerase family protein [Mycolicibacterium chlorophenolicum]|uniref:Putative enoyl-CoA hydratase echA8 n=1 Tax=Mycolicibacterium chlorophenolicum TaxID=37916 RepID=A0A0J6WNJ2_9MYCO|nr:enoyl-CoA hydratase/isomerase family protein [Mycolicibacterium chlorophenolicum]KMO83648.1 putative enoyl-CoA hydratase echA8 [Mycolicibacterium chlorophenolicum]
MVDQAEIRVDIEGNLAWVVLDSPPGNLLDAESAERLTQTLQHLDADDSVDAVALTGGGTNFCAGVNIPKLVKTETVQAFARAAVDLFGHFALARKPILAAVNGDALAGGFGLLCSADIVVAADHARMGTIEASLGTWPALAKIPGLHRVPPKAMITNCLTGVPFSAQRAYELNIVDEIVPLDQLRARVRDYAELAVRGGTAARAGRALFYRAAALPLAEGLSEGAKLFVSSFS